MNTVSLSVKEPNKALDASLQNITIGAGQQTGPIEYGPPPTFEPTSDEVAANYVPSVRTVVQGAVKTVATALATPVPTPTPPPTASAASVRADVAEAAPAAEAVTGGDSSEAAPAGDSTEAAPAAEAAAEKPARKAARAARGAAARG